MFDSVYSGFVVTLNIATVNNIYSYQDISSLHSKIYLTMEQFNDLTILDSTNTTETLNPCQVAQLNVAICQIYWISQVALNMSVIILFQYCSL